MATESIVKATNPPAEVWAEFRRQMPVANKWAYFDHAAVAPIPKPAHDVMVRWASEALLEGDAVWPDWNHLHEDCRNTAARLLNAERSEIGLIPNTTFGINLVADGLAWESGENVVLPEHEFPSNIYPWQALSDRGVEVRQVPLDGHKINVDRLVDAIDEKTKIVSASWVGYASGYRIDPKEVSAAVHEKGALFFLDAIQGLGVFPLDVKDADIDFLSADGHKWMLGPEGAGLFYLKREHLDLLRPMNVGWNSVSQGNDYTNVSLNVRNAASRYEGGTQNMAGFIGLGASLKVLESMGLSSTSNAIGDRVIEVSDQLIKRLRECGAVIHTERGNGIDSGIVLFEIPGKEPAAVRKQLLDHQVITSCRGGHVRAAVHAYNNQEDIEKLIGGIQSIA